MLHKESAVCVCVCVCVCVPSSWSSVCMSPGRFKRPPGSLAVWIACRSVEKIQNYFIYFPLVRFFIQHVSFFFTIAPRFLVPVFILCPFLLRKKIHNYFIYFLSCSFSPLFFSSPLPLGACFEYLCFALFCESNCRFCVII